MSRAGAAEASLQDMLEDLWRARRWLAAGGALGLAFALILLLLAVPQYRAAMLIAPTTRQGTPDISGLFPDNASFAMEYVLQSFGPGDSSDFMRFQAILHEPSVAALLLKQPIIRAGLQQAGRWKFKSGPRLDDPARLAAWLTDQIEIEPVGATRLQRVIFNHPDPRFAVAMLQAMYDTADTLIRSELETKTKKRIAYLTQTVEATANPEQRRALTKLLMDQEQIATVLAVHEPFSATMAEPPVAAPNANWPRRAVVLPASVLVGMFMAFVAYSLRRRRA